MKVRERGRLYPSLHFTTRTSPALRWASDESHFNVSLIMRVKVTTQCHHQTTTFALEKGEPKRNRTEVHSAYQPNTLPLKPAHEIAYLWHIFHRMDGVLPRDPLRLGSKVDTDFWRGEPRAESNRGPSAYQPNALPLGQTGLLMTKWSKPVLWSAWWQFRQRQQHSYTWRGFG